MRVQVENLSYFGYRFDWRPNVKTQQQFRGLFNGNFITFLSVLDKLNDCELTRIIVELVLRATVDQTNRFIRPAVNLFQLIGIGICINALDPINRWF